MVTSSISCIKHRMMNSWGGFTIYVTTTILTRVSSWNYTISFSLQKIKILVPALGYKHLCPESSIWLEDSSKLPKHVANIAYQLNDPTQNLLMQLAAFRVL